MNIAPVILPAGRLAAGLRAAIQASGAQADGEDPTVTIVRTLPDKSIDENSRQPMSQADAICDLREQGLSVRTSAGGLQNWHYIAVNGGDPGVAAVNVQTPFAGAGDAMIEAFLAATGLERYVVPERSDPTKEEEAPHEAGLHSTPRPPEQRLRAFISYRFGSPANAAAAGSIQRLLELLNVEVLTGNSYEPRPLHEKVADRLVGLDLLVLFIGADGQSAWTRDEISTARALGVPVVPLVTAGSTFEPGLFGDLEYITVAPDHVGDGFVALLEAVTYVRRKSDQ